MLSKAMVTLSAATMLAAASAAPAAAQYCASYTSGGRNCGFQTMAQCQVTVRGIGGFCTSPAIAQQPTRAPAFGAFATEPVKRIGRERAQRSTR